ncbi:MAG: DUF4270 domain-containing protein [Chitinophagales bacterium]|nr:DUF4270 domain-containing protein [Chitinophagales bacterium]
MRDIKFILMIAIVAVLVSCKKDDGFGSNLLPQENHLNLTYDESYELKVSSKYESPLRTDRLMFNYLGYTENPIFGSTTASTAIQFGLPSKLSEDLGPFTVKDANLYLFYDAFVGDTLEPVSYTVHALSSEINTSIIYKSNEIIPFKSEELGALNNFLIQPNIPQKLRENDTITAKSFLKFSLDKSYAEGIVQLLNEGVITNDTLLNRRFPGVYVQTRPSQKGKTILQLDLTHLTGGIYINLIDKKGEDQIFVLPFSTSNFMHTSLINDYQGSIVDNAIQSGTSPLEDKFYLQSQAGVKTEVEFLDIEKFKGKLINKAILEVSEVEAPLTNFKRVNGIYPLLKGSNGDNEALKDYTTAFYGPARMDTTVVGSDGVKIKKYEVNITNLLKDYALGKKDLKSIYLTNYPIFDLTPKFIIGSNSVLSQYIEPASLIIGGPQYANPEKRMKFKVWYTTIK